MYVEDFAAGMVLETPGRTIDASDIALFGGLVGDLTPIHIDEPAARAQGLPGRIAHGTLSLATAIGLLTQLGVMGEAVIGALSTEWSFLAPVVAGSTIRATVTIESARVTSKPDRGVVVFAFDVFDQARTRVLEGRLTVMMRTRDHG